MVASVLAFVALAAIAGAIATRYGGDHPAAAAPSPPARLSAGPTTTVATTSASSSPRSVASPGPGAEYSGMNP
jgi:hypothetical protein